MTLDCQLPYNQHVMISERSIGILEALVREYIRTGEPVSSGWLYEKYDFGIKPAMIRAELNDLSEKGFLEQPHHSSGRVPGDKAFELFAEKAMEKAREIMDGEFIELMALREWNGLVEHLSEELNLMGAVYAGHDHAHKEGLSGLIENLDWNSKEELERVIKDFEEFDERAEKICETLNNENKTRVFIGKKSPVTKSDKLSVMIKSCDIDGEKIAIFAIGPKRMDYEKVAEILKGLNIN